MNSAFDVAFVYIPLVKDYGQCQVFHLQPYHRHRKLIKCLLLKGTSELYPTQHGVSVKVITCQVEQPVYLSCGWLFNDWQFSRQVRHDEISFREHDLTSLSHLSCADSRPRVDSEFRSIPFYPIAFYSAIDMGVNSHSGSVYHRAHGADVFRMASQSAHDKLAPCRLHHALLRRTVVYVFLRIFRIIWILTSLWVWIGGGLGTSIACGMLVMIC